jgi:uncharacterized protein
LPPFLPSSACAADDFRGFFFPSLAAFAFAFWAVSDPLPFFSAMAERYPPSAPAPRVGDVVHELSQEDARRIALQAQLLDAERPSSVLEVVRHLTLVQNEPTAPLGAPTADLVLWSRLGAAYDRAELVDLIDQQLLIEHQGFIRPSEDMALFRAEMTLWPGREPLREWQLDTARWVQANDACRREILDLLRREGPLPATAFDDTCEVPWPSSGWNNHRNVQMLLKHMVARGEVAAAGREGRQKLWDLAERVYPDDPVPDPDEAQRILHERRLRALGLGRSRNPAALGGEYDVGEAGEPAVVEGVRGEWRVDPELLARPFTGRTALLSPFDRLVQDRRRLDQLFGFDYLLEMYKPVEQRIWGYYALPVLHEDRLVGKLDATAEPDEGVLRVDHVHEDVDWPAATREAVEAEIEALAAWLGLEVMRLD